MAFSNFWIRLGILDSIPLLVKMALGLLYTVSGIEDFHEAARLNEEGYDSAYLRSLRGCIYILVASIIWLVTLLRGICDFIMIRRHRKRPAEESHGRRQCRFCGIKMWGFLMILGLIVSILCATVEHNHNDEHPIIGYLWGATAAFEIFVLCYTVLIRCSNQRK